MKLKCTKLRFLLFALFIFNSFLLYLNFSTDHYHQPTNSIPHSLSENSLTQIRSSLKPWPILPSYLPWSLGGKSPIFHSCEAYFGNGFTRRVDLLKPISEPRRMAGNRGGWFRCFYSETLRSSICEGGRIRMIPGRISMSQGGENLESVIGRGEDEEMPKFEDGAFEIEVGDRSSVGKKLVDEEFLNRYVQQGGIQRHSMRALIGSIRQVDAAEFVCNEWIEEPTLLVTRYEYANVFHTFTDWYSTYVSSRVTGLSSRPHVVFVDGHCETQLEETWSALYSSLSYAKNFTGPVCFRRAILVPLGYETAMFRGLSEHINCHGTTANSLWLNPDDQKTARLSEFGEMIRSAFVLPVDRHNLKPLTPQHDILFVRREDYFAHPRHHGKVQTRLSNELEVFEAISNWAANHSHTSSTCKLNVINGTFAHMSMKEQVAAIGNAAVIIGAHGAGLTHMISANMNTVIFEIISSEYIRPHFELIAMWKGLEYHAMNLHGSYADPKEVIKRLNTILTSIGC